MSRRWRRALLAGALPVLLLVLAHPSLALAQEQVPACAALPARPFDPPVLRGPLRAEQLGACDAARLYYGFGAKPEHAAALQCALHQRANPSGRGDIFEGAGVLSMLYANGRGVRRDIDAAMRLVCENRWASPAEIQWRLEHLDAMRENRAARFDLCDDISSGLAQGWCAWKEAQFNQARRAAALKAYAARFSPPARAAFARLRTAEAAFAQARAEEVDQTGTARGMLVIEDQELQAEQFLINLRSFSRGDLPAAGAREAEDAEQALAGQLARLEREFGSPNGDALTTVTLAGIQRTHAAWLTARQAWLDLAPLAWPALGPERLRWRLTRQRVNQLQRL